MEGRTLYIGNLSDSLRKETLIELFSAYGNVTGIKIVGYNAFGFIEMSNQTEAENAKKSLNGYNIEGSILKVDEARPKIYRRSGNSHRHSQAQ
jgi:RNA recognition motif-containing protein